MTDALVKVRRKSRLIVEARYPAAPRFVDIRGSVIASIHPTIKQRMPHWQSDMSSVTFGDDPINPVNQFTIAYNRIAVILEDPGTVQEFVDTAIQYLGFAYNVFGKELGEVSRVGVRFIGVHVGAQEDYDALAALVRSKFHVLPKDLPLDYLDSMARLVHKQGSFYVGPTKQGDQWLSTVFLRPTQSVPKAGIGIDVDSNARELTIRSRDDLTRSFNGVLALTTSTEELLARHLGLIDE